MLNWNDIRYFLAVSRTGSSAGAGRALGVDQTTVSRRLTKLERTIGTTLFERRPDGYCIRPEAACLLGTAERLEAEVETFRSLARRARSRRRADSRDHQRAARQRHPGAGYRAVSRPLPGVRSTSRSRPANSIWRAARRTWRCGRSAVRRRGSDRPQGGRGVLGHLLQPRLCPPSRGPRTLADLAQHVLIVEEFGGSRSVELTKAAGGIDRRTTVNDLCIAARAGLGVVSLPCVLGDNQPDLRRCFVQPEPVNPVWLIYHRRLRQAAALRALLDAVIEQAAAAHDALGGLSHQPD